MPSPAATRYATTAVKVCMWCRVLSGILGVGLLAFWLFTSLTS